MEPSKLRTTEIGKTISQLERIKAKGAAWKRKISIVDVTSRENTDTFNPTEAIRRKRSGRAEDKLLLDKLKSQLLFLEMNVRKSNVLNLIKYSMPWKTQKQLLNIRCGICKEIKFNWCVQQIEIMKERLNTSNANTMINVSLTEDLPEPDFLIVSPEFTSY
ncbi:unnamed protein product [Mytilus coruscus]|uniref:Uncharacterized protein n=1 Tax=Mytilus coruscus TaxID=42192 RepID=A0A6J8CL12_MYTCO|nr:unnamed protein product [Mytilus coruscus]